MSISVTNKIFLIHLRILYTSDDDLFDIDEGIYKCKMKSQNNLLHLRQSKIPFKLGMTFKSRLEKFYLWCEPICFSMPLRFFFFFVILSKRVIKTKNTHLFLNK